MKGDIGRFRRRHLVPVPAAATLAALNELIAAGDEVDDGRVITGSARWSCTSAKSVLDLVLSSARRLARGVPQVEDAIRRDEDMIGLDDPDLVHRGMLRALGAPDRRRRSPPTSRNATFAC